MVYTDPYQEDFLTGKRKLGDPAADLLIGRQFQTPEGKKELQQWLGGLNFNDQLTGQNPLTEAGIIRHAGQLPPWAKPKQMQCGSAFFAAHAGEIMSLLGLLSLPYCYTAANGAMVLYLSHRMRNDTQKRLTETAGFVWEVMAPDAFTSQGKGFASILKVRLIHAAVRYYTLLSGKWLAEWGTPVNQEDMAGTNLSFSLLVIRGLRKLGYTINPDEQQGFMHLWNVIGYLSGVGPDMIPEDTKQAQILEAKIKARQFKVSEHGRALTLSLTNYIQSANVSGIPHKEVLGLMRYLLGYDVADMLQITAPDMPAYQLRLLQFRNSLKDIVPRGKPAGAYRRSYHDFKKQSRV